MTVERGKVEFQHVSISPRSIGKIVTTEYGNYYIDVARDFMTRTKKVFLFIDESGNIEPVIEGRPWRNRYIIHSESEGIPPATNLWDFNVFVETPETTLEEAFKMAREVLAETVVFPHERDLDYVTAWCMYSWLRGLFPKNVNVYFTGFPGTGKSQALKFIKLFGRYPADYDPLATKSFKWTIHHSLGILILDEAEYLTRSSIARLRRYHETDIYEQRTIGLPLVGLTSIDLRVDAPIAMAATHVPADIAFMQRGLLFRMVKRSPKVKDFSRIPHLDYIQKVFAKTVLINWKRITESAIQVTSDFEREHFDERVKDLAFPIATIFKALGRPIGYPLAIALISFIQAYYATIEGTVFALVLKDVHSMAWEERGRYIIPIRKVMEAIGKITSEFGLKREKMLYLTQYFFAGAHVRWENNELCYVIDKETFDSFIMSLGIPTSSGDIIL